MYNLGMKKRNITVMYLISLFQGMVFYASVSTLYRTARGLSLSQYALIDSITFVFTLALEVPWGVVADRIGYKKTLLIANGLYALSKLVFLKAWGFWGFLLERVFFAAAVSGLSGVDMSVLYLSCDKDESQKVFGRYRAFGNAGMLISAGLFSLLKMTHQQAALFTLMAYRAGLLLSFMLVEVKGEQQQEERPEFSNMLKMTLKDFKMMLYLGANALISVSTWVIIVFINQNHYLSLGRPESFIGYTFIITGLLDFLGVYSHKVTDVFGDLKGGLILIMTMALAALGLSFSRNLYLSVALICLTDLRYTLYGPLTNRIESDYVKIADRATMLSIYMMINDLFSIIPDVLMGYSAERSLPLTFRLCALALIMAGIGYRYFVRRKNED